MAGHGFVLYSDVSDRLIQHLSEEPIKAVSGENWSRLERMHDQAGDMAPLYMVFASLANMIPSYSTHHIHHSPMHQIGNLTNGDAETAAQHTYGHGLDDRKFTWTFAGSLAAAVAHAFTQTGEIEEDKLGQLTLTDWANMISSQWFSRLAHNFARTGNGMLQNFGGEGSGDYAPYALEKKLRSGANSYPDKAYPTPDIDQPLLIIDEELDTQTGAIQLIARLSEPYRQMLRNYRINYRNDIAQGGSVGCPVARRFAQLPEEFVESDAHMQHLRQIGLMSVRSVDEETGKTLIGQEDTAIDRTLAFIAWQLTEYDRQHGTPSISKGEDCLYLAHEQRAPSNLFIKSAKLDEPAALEAK